MTDTWVQALVFTAIDDVNPTLPPIMRLRKEREVVLTGGGREIDSLGLVSLLATIEARLKAERGTVVLLDSALAGAAGGNPLKSIGVLIDHLAAFLDDAGTKTEG
jgi:hypothetical protein